MSIVNHIKHVEEVQKLSTHYEEFKMIKDLTAFCVNRELQTDAPTQCGEIYKYIVKYLINKYKFEYTHICGKDGIIMNPTFTIDDTQVELNNNTFRKFMKKYEKTSLTSEIYNNYINTAFSLLNAFTLGHCMVPCYEKADDAEINSDDKISKLIHDVRTTGQAKLKFGTTAWTYFVTPQFARQIPPPVS